MGGENNYIIYIDCKIRERNDLFRAKMARILGKYLTGYRRGKTTHNYYKKSEALYRETCMITSVSTELLFFSA